MGKVMIINCVWTSLVCGMLGCAAFLGGSGDHAVASDYRVASIHAFTGSAVRLDGLSR